MGATSHRTAQPNKTTPIQGAADMKAHRTSFRRPTWYRARFLSAGLLLLGVGVIVLPASAPGKSAVRAVSIVAQVTRPHITVTTPKSQIECEEEYGKGTSWRRCFKQPPGSSCAHPLEVQKAGATTRGDARDFTTTVHEEAVGGINVATEVYYAWVPKKGIAMCPYPNGVVYKVSLLAEEEFCETIHGKKYCAIEYDTKNIPMHTSPTGGSFEYHLTDQPLKGGYVAIRGYYIQTPGRHSG
jgi:hypothetical protein